MNKNVFQNYKKIEYLILTRYCLIGIILAILVFQFTTKSLTSHSLSFNALWSKETFILLIAVLIGGLLGVLIFMFAPQNEIAEIARWKRLLTKGKSNFILVNVLIFSFSFFIAGLVLVMLDMETYDHFFAALFSQENSINYSGRVISAAVFGVFYSLGMIKRMQKQYLNKDDKFKRVWNYYNETKKYLFCTSSTLTDNWMYDF